MRNFLIVIAAGFVASAVPASAEPRANLTAPDNSIAEAQQGGGSSTATRANAERRICLDVELTGSRMVRRVCRTQAEWEARGGLEPAN